MATSGRSGTGATPAATLRRCSSSHVMLTAAAVLLLMARAAVHGKDADTPIFKKFSQPKVSIQSNEPGEYYNSESILYFEVGKIYHVDCFINGYPMPEVEWVFKKCPNYPECEELYTDIPRDMYNVNVLREITLISSVNITANETGVLMCKAKNEYGSANDSFTLLETDISNGLAIKGPQLLVEGDNITIECGASKYEYRPDIKWFHRTLNNDMSLRNIDEGLFITNNQTKLSYRSYLMIKNITNKADGEYVCSVIKFNNEQDKINKSYSVVVKNSEKPVIYDSFLIDFNVTIGKSIEWKCSARGMPPPTVTWFKNGQPLQLAKNNSRVLLKDNNQTLLIHYTALEDEGLYVCIASNRIGSAISSNNLNLVDKPKEPEHFGFITFCAVLIILLGILIIGHATHLKREQKLKKELALAGLSYFENGAVDSWNPDLGIEEQAELLPYDKRWEFPREKIKLGKQLGSGAFGVVFKAEAIGIIEKDTTTTVAVKMMKPNTDLSCIKALATELKIMIHLGRHLNVVNLLGAYTGNINKKELMVMWSIASLGIFISSFLNKKIVL